MRVGLLYTATTPQLIELVEDAVRQELGEVEFFSRQDASIIADVRDAGYVTASAAAKQLALYLQAVEAGCDAVLSVCSSVADVVDAAQGIAAYVGVPFVRIDEDMCREAAKRAARIGVVATLPAAVDGVKRTIQRMSRECARPVAVVDCLLDGGADLVQGVMASDAVAMQQVDVLVLAQASMASQEAAIAAACQTDVLSSPRFGATALRRALEERGTL